MNTPPPQNRQTLDQLRELESERPGLMKELIRLFVADAPKQMRLIAAAYGARDPEGLRQAAHFLRSGSLALGLSALAELSRQVEQLPRERYGSPETDKQLVDLRAEVHRVLLALLGQLKG